MNSPIDPNCKIQASIIRCIIFILTILTLIVLPHPVYARRPMGAAMTGDIQQVDHSTREIVFVQDGGLLRKFVYSRSAKFWRGSSEASPTALKSGTRVEVKLRQPFFGPDFVTRIVQVSSSTK